MKSQLKIEKGLPWVLIILFMIWFFPLGIVLMISKLNREKHRYIPNGKAIFGVGWFVIVVGLIGISAFISDGVENGEATIMMIFFILFVFGGGGFVLVMLGGKYKKRGEQLVKYSAIISENSKSHLDEIAAVYPKSYEQVCKDLQRLINDGFFPGSYLDLNQRKFISPDAKARSKERTATQHTPEPSAQKLKVVKCPNCGATNTVKHQVGECEYCGSPLT